MSQRPTNHPLFCAYVILNKLNAKDFHLLNEKAEAGMPGFVSDGGEFSTQFSGRAQPNFQAHEFETRFQRYKIHPCIFGIRRERGNELNCVVTFSARGQVFG